MKRSKKIIIFLCSIIILIISSVFLFNIKEQNKKMSGHNVINITNLSNEFVDNYLAEVNEIKEEEKENILIVTSLEKIDESYGAVKIIEAPNNQYILQYDSEEEKEEALSNLKKDEDVISAEENVFYNISETTYNSWGVETMALDYATNLANGKDLNDITVAIIDTGCDIDLFNKYYNSKILETYNVLEDSTEIMTDENGHGTHIAGTIAESTPDNVKILPIKVSSGREISSVDIIAAINYVTKYQKADVMNMSFGGYQYSSAIEDAIEAARQVNIITVAAAGNNNTSASHFPSALDNTISIASVDAKLNKSSFSNYGSTIDFAVAGSNIKSIMSSDATISKENGNTDGNEHETISGTSMATPHAASAVAILKSYNKDLTLEDTMELLKNRSLDLGRIGWDKYYGYGFISFVDAQFCDGTDCDEYNVFKADSKLEIVDIGPKDSNSYVIAYNYGNVTNLMNQSIKIYYGDDAFIIKQLSELDDVVIENYDPNIIYNDQTQEGIQIVTIKYGGYSTTINVMNYTSESVWKYEKISENSIKLVGRTNEVISNSLPSVVYIPEVIDGYTVVEIGDQLFENEVDLRKVSFAATIEKIGIEAFNGCSYLAEVDLSDNIQIIENYAFKNTNLESIVFPESLLKIGEGAFENSTILEISIPKNVNEIGDYAFAGCNNVEEIKVDVNNIIYDSRDESNAIIETATNTLIKGNYNTNLVNTIEVIGAGAFYNDNRIGVIAIPSSVTTIETAAFKYDSNLIVSNLKVIFIPRSVTTITNAFNSRNKNITIYTYSDAVAREYAFKNYLAYTTIDYVSILSYLSSYKYNAFDKIGGNLIVIADYDVGYYKNDTYYYGTERYYLVNNDVSELEQLNVEISYIDGRDSLRYGDTYVTVKGKDLYDNDFESNCMVEVSKLVPEYTLPSGLVAKAGQKLSEVELPDEFSWLESDTIITGYGDVVFKAKFTPEDTNNYEVVEDIEITINVSKTEVTPSIVISDKTYDGTNTINLDSIKVSNLDNIDYTIESAVISSSDVGNRQVTIKIKISDDDYLIYAFDNNLQEKEFVVDMLIVPQKISKPTIVNKTYKYTGLEQTIELNNFDSEKLNISGNKRTIAGTQDVVISLNSSNYIWDDDTNDNIVFQFKIEKADLNLVDNSKDVTVEYDGLDHSIDVSFDYNPGTNIRYMDENGEYTLENLPQYNSVGTYVIKYKLYIDDNYTEYFGEKTLNIISCTIVNNSTDYKGLYDGKEHSINLDFSVSDYTIKYSINNYNYDLDELPKFSEVGEYVVNYKVTCSFCNELIGSNKVIIYGIEEIDSSLKLENNVLLVTNQSNSFTDISNKIKLFASSYSISHYDQNNREVNTDTVGTGHKLVINISDSEKIEYTISILGDVTGDGIVNIADVIKIADHTIKGNILINDYELKAVDVTGDNIINIADVIKIADYTLDNSINLWR